MIRTHPHGPSTSRLRWQRSPTCFDVKARLEAGGIEVVGPTDHKLFQSINFVDLSGHRVEIAANIATAAMMQWLDEVKWQMRDEFDLSKRPPRYASWLPDGGDAKN